MAMKKDALIDEPAVEEAEEEKVTIRIPITRENQADVFVRVNQRTWLIKRGVSVTVPKCVVEVLENSENAMMEALEYQNKVQRD